MLSFGGTAIFVDRIKVANVIGFERIQDYGNNLSTTMTGFAANDVLYGAGGRLWVSAQ